LRVDFTEAERPLGKTGLNFRLRFIFQWKKHRFSPWLMDQRRARSTVDRPPWPAVELTRARSSGRSGTWLLAVRWGKEGGRHGNSISPSTEAWRVARRRRTSGGTLAQKGNDVGVVERRRGQADGVGVFRWGGGPFIGLGEGHRGGEGRVTAGDAVVFNDRVILGSS
jgi:hypothetical protein